MNRHTLGRLEKWRSSLDVCIRCGYCYAHCPIYKSTRWETDSPRAKLALIYGMLNGEVEPSDYIAEKMLECFYCKSCQTNCSSSIPITEILTDAQADLREAGFLAKGTTSETSRAKCALCLACVRMCKHEARSYDGSIVVDRVKCQSCGACLEVCPGRGISMNRGFGTEEEVLQKEVARFLKPDGSRGAKVIVFGCDWTSYPGFQVSEMCGPGREPEYTIIVAMCAGRLQSRLIMDALMQGAWGVLVTMCPEGKCEHDGNVRATAMLASFQKALETLDVAPQRVRRETVEKGNTKQMEDAIKGFMKQIRELGPVLTR